MAHPAEFFIKYLLVADEGISPESINSTLELHGISSIDEDDLALLRQEMSGRHDDFRPWDKSHRPTTSWLKKKRVFSLFHPDVGTKEMKERILSSARTREKVDRLLLGNVSYLEASHRLTKLGMAVSDSAIAEYCHYFWNTHVMGITDWAKYLEKDSSERTSAVRSAYSLAMMAGPEAAMYRIGVQRQLDGKKIMMEVQAELYHSFLETRTLPLSAKKVEMLASLARGLARIDERVQAGDSALQETLKKFEKFKVLHNEKKPPSLLDLAPTGSVSNRSRNEILTSGTKA
jgi:hypothetical protein